MLKTKVILAEVTNLSEARYAAGMGVEYLSFNLNPGDVKYVTADLVKSISEWVAGISIIGNIGNQPIDSLQDYPLNLILVSSSKLLNHGQDKILYLEVDEENISSLASEMSEFSSSVDFFILSVKEELIHLHSEELRKLCENFSVYLSTLLNSSNVIELIESINPHGIVLYGNEEDRPGNSNYEGIAEVLEQLELD